MTENKRFKYYEHKGADYILENPNEDLDFIEMLGDCLDSEEIVNRLNELYNKIEQLKKDVKCHEERIAILIQLLDIADIIIDLGDDETAKEFWEKMNDNMDSKWGELNKKAKRDYTSGGIYDD